MQSNIKKPKFKFNFIDILILALLLTVIVFSVYNTIMTENSSPADGSDGFEYILKVERVDNELLPLIGLGDVIYEQESGMEIGKVVDITVFDYTESDTEGESGEQKAVEGFSNLEITIDCNGTSYIDDGGTVNVQSNGYNMRVGTDIRVRNTEFIFTARCLLSEKAEVNNEEA